MEKDDFEDEVMEQVEELKLRLKDDMNTEMYADTLMFKRFLKARNYDINAAENMLRNHLIWRKVNRVDTMLNWYTPPEVLAKYMPFSRICFDKEGSLVTYIDYGNLDARGCLKSTKVADQNKFFTNRFEVDVKVLKEQSQKLGRPINQWVCILNFENFPLSTATHKPSLDAIGKMISIYEANYPERLKCSILINASWYFQICFAIVRPLISSETQKKFMIFGKDGWKEELLNRIDADVLPAFLGGSRTDPNGDPMCRTFVNHGGKVPEHYFTVNKNPNFSAEPGVKKIIVNRLSKFNLELEVMHPNSVIEWEFETKKHDIEFSLLYKENATEREVIPKQRVDTSLWTETGIFKCEEIGTYILEFDNIYSWIYQKEVYYKVGVTSPDSNTTV